MKNKHTRQKYVPFNMWVCLELVIVCSFIFDKFFRCCCCCCSFCSVFRVSFLFVHSSVVWFAFINWSYCRNCFSVLWLINTHWPYVQIECNKMNTYSNHKSTHARVRFDLFALINICVHRCRAVVVIAHHILFIFTPRSTLEIDGRTRKRVQSNT